MLYLLKKFWQKITRVEKNLLLFFILILIGSITTLLVSNSRGRIEVPAHGGTYTEGLVGMPERVNPLLAPTNDLDMDLARIVYAGLLKFDRDLNLAPDLAAALPEISGGGKIYTVKLRSGLRWQDGVELTADDVVFTYRAIQNADLRSPLRRSWNKVDVEKIDPLTVKITTKESSAPFIANLAVGIIPKHIWEAVPAESFALSKYNLEPIGAGPFQIAEIKRGRNGEIREVRMKAFKQYHAGAPYLENLIFKFYPTPTDLIDAYHSRAIAGLGYVPFDKNLFIEPKEKLQQLYLSLSQYQAVFVNRTKNPAPLEDIKVRLALAKSVDKKKIIADVFENQASEAYGPILPGHLGYHEQIPGADMNIYDLERAKALLEEAGWQTDAETGFRKDKQGRIITLSLATNNFPPNVRVAQELKEMWEAIGIQIILNIETFGDLEEKYIRPREYELLLLSENVGPDPDPYPLWHSSQLRDPGVNFSTFSNMQADKLLTDARANILPAERAAKYKQFQEILVGDVPAIFVDRGVFVYNLPQTLKGVALNTIYTPSERFADIHEWYIETKKVKN